jgi:hypothetical protein
MLTYAVTGYDGDPNAGGAPAIVSGAPAGAFYLQQTGAVLWSKKTSAAGSYEVVGAAGASQRFTTTSDITVTIDPSDPTAADPPGGTVFVDQTEVDAWLAAQGTTKFKLIEPFYNALPTFVLHNVVINLAAGAHRPFSGTIYSTAFDFNHKHIFGKLDIVGALPSTWTPLYGLTGLTITAYQAANRDPYVDFAGTPFSGLDLRALYVVFSTGQAALIHDHTDSRLYVTSVIAPSPVGGTCFVGQPSSILRNSLDDVATYKDGTLALGTGVSTSATSASATNVVGRAYIRNVVLDPFGGSSNVCSLHPSYVRVEYLLLDQETLRWPPFSKSPNGNGFSCLDSKATVALYLCAVRDKNTAGGGADSPLNVVICTGITFYGCYFENGEDPVTVGSLRLIVFYGSVFHAVAQPAVWQTAMLWVSPAQALYFFDLGTSGFSGMGKDVEFRNSRAAVPALRISVNVSLYAGYASFRFKGNLGPLIYLEDHAIFEAILGPTDAGGNTDYGIVFSGGGAIVKLGTSAALAPTLGAVKMKDGSVITSLDDVKALGPIVDDAFNTIEKA